MIGKVIDFLSLTLLSRAISVILGDKWKKMKSEERRMYTMEAKALAEEQKRLNPDCWKRKRTNSVRMTINSCIIWYRSFHNIVQLELSYCIPIPPIVFYQGSQQT